MLFRSAKQFRVAGLEFLLLFPLHSLLLLAERIQLCQIPLLVEIAGLKGCAALFQKGDGFPKTEDNKSKNELLAALTPEQKGVLAEMLQDEHIAGIHDTLAYINEMMNLEGLELHQDGESYPNDYFESLHYDFTSHCDGDEWPE